MEKLASFPVKWSEVKAVGIKALTFADALFVVCHCPVWVLKDKIFCELLAELRIFRTG